MTTIAWDGKDLVADQLRYSNGMTLVTNKLYHVPATKGFPESVCGITGSEIEGRSIIDWMRKGSVIADFPVRYDSENETEIIRYFKEKVEGAHVHVYRNSPISFVHHMSFGAWGSGAELATMALHLGCDAKSAIEHTSIFNAYTSRATQSANDLFHASKSVKFKPVSNKK